MYSEFRVFRRGSQDHRPKAIDMNLRYSLDYATFKGRILELVNIGGARMDRAERLWRTGRPQDLIWVIPAEGEQHIDIC